MQKLSLVLITHNAGGQLTACLESARGVVDDIVVVDSGSDDDTLAVAVHFGARTIRQTFLGFGAQKRLAVSQARYDWVLCLDADERLTPELSAAIRAELAAPAFAAYRVARRNQFLGRYLRHGEGYPDFNIRLFDRRLANWTEDRVHEHVISAAGAGPVGTLSGDLLHDSAESLSIYLAKQNRYTDIQADALFRQGRSASPWQLVTSPLVRFLRFYIVRKGFLDGAAGFAHIAIGSFFAFVKYAKLMERWRKKT